MSNTTKILVKVTKSVISRSIMCGTLPKKNRVGSNCAISIAINDLLQNSWVDSICIYKIKDSTIWSEILEYEIPQFDFSYKKINLPIEATKFIRQFDKLKSTPQERLELPEISFEIDVPDEWLEGIAENEIKELLKESKTLELVN